MNEKLYVDQKFLTEKLEHSTKFDMEWFENNYIKLNEDKSPPTSRTQV